LISLGDKLFADGQIDPALAQFQAAAKLDSNNAQTQLRLANAYALVGRLAEANAAANQAVQIEPNNPQAHAQLARALSWSGQSDAAIAEAQKALSLDAGNVAARAFLSEAYLRAGRPGDAQREAEAAVKADANSAEAHRANAWYLIVTKSDDGTKEWNRVVELAPNLFFYHFEYGEVLRTYLNDVAKSVNEYQRASQLYPPYVPAYVSLGQAYLTLNQPANAILQFQKAITFDPNSADAFAYLGVGFKLQGKCSQAIPYFQRALELNSKLASAASGLNDCGVPNQAVPAPTVQGTPRPAAVPTTIVPATIVPLPPASPDASATKASAQPAAAFAGQIAFATYDGQYHLYLYTAQGGKKLLTELANTPMLSPEGTQILFQSWTADRRGIHRIDVDGSEDDQISLHSEDTNPSWSPDGTQYVYATRAGPGVDVNSRPFTLRLSDPTSKSRQDPALFMDKAQAPAWSRQDRIVFRDCGFPNDACGLAVVDSDGTGKKSITTLNSAAPAWSPDSTKIAFMSDADRGNWDIWLVASNGGSPQRLTDDPAEDGLPAWSPDGRFIAFVSKRGGTWGLWLMNADGTNQRKLTDLGGDPFGTIKGSPSGQPGQTWIEQRISWSK
jgi:tetratricopeptide (TPR) repeat protein